MTETLQLRRISTGETVTATRKVYKNLLEPRGEFEEIETGTLVICNEEVAPVEVAID